MTAFSTASPFVPVTVADALVLNTGEMSLTSEEVLELKEPVGAPMPFADVSSVSLTSEKVGEIEIVDVFLNMVLGLVARVAISSIRFEARVASVQYSATTD